MESLADFFDPGSEQLSTESAPAINCQNPSHLHDARLLHKRAEIGGDPSFVLKKDVQAFGIHPVDVLIYTVLLHDENRGPRFQDFVQLPGCQIGKVFRYQIHWNPSV